MKIKLFNRTNSMTARIILGAALALGCFLMFSGVAMKPTTDNPWKSSVHPTLTAEERALVSEMLAEMYGHKSEPVEPVQPVEDDAQALSGPISLTDKPTVKVEPVEPWYTEWEWEILAIIIYQEAGGDAASDDTRIKVGEVFLNRVNDPRFPDTFEEVATGKGQYGELYWTGIKWPDRAQYPGEAHAVERAWEIAERVLNGERTMPDGVIWQAEFPQGSEIIAIQDGHYFCR